MKRILIIEDDNHINELLYDLLREKYEMTQAYAGSEGKRLLEKESFDLILLDLMLPGLSGEEVIKEIRKKSNTPIIVITAKAEVDVLANVLQLGANDYIAKPFNTIEVIARVEAQLRDHQMESKENESSLLQVGPVQMNEETREVWVHGNAIALTQKEYALLKCFLQHPKKVFTKANLYETVWGETYFGDDNTISVHMSRLRTKLNDFSEVDCIETVWGVGFKLKIADQS
jgi:DNA-binding response OmpR family regulator